MAHLKKQKSNKGKREKTYNNIVDTDSLGTA
jgi:hypothetical protein